MISLRRKKKPVFQVESPDHIIIPAFHDGVEQMYMFEDIFKTPYKRALGALTYYEELRMRVSREFLQADCAAHRNLNDKIAEVLSGKNGHINMVTAINLLNQSNELLQQKEERLNWVFEPELLYKLASVMFFDKHESPYSYDMKYCQAKISRWKQSQEITDFFYHEPILKLVPYLAEFKGDIRNWMKVVSKVATLHLDNTYGLLSTSQKEGDLGKNLLLLRETLQESEASAEV